MGKPSRTIGFQLRELAGSIPPDHRPLKSEVAGPRAVQPRQIWVDRQTDELWEIVRVSAGTSNRKFRFALRLYGGYWDRKRELSWSSLKSGFQVLEAAIHSRQERLSVLRHDYANAESGSEKFPDAASFIRSFGFDPETGFRID
jgi:hypothetical protein